MMNHIYTLMYYGSYMTDTPSSTKILKMFNSIVELEKMLAYDENSGDLRLNDLVIILKSDSDLGMQSKKETDI